MYYNIISVNEFSPKMFYFIVKPPWTKYLNEGLVTITSIMNVLMHVFLLASVHHITYA